jgi:uncharacterized protein (DUF488 family)
MGSISVFTIGYEEKSIDEFISRLKKFHINVLVDVREIPASRKAGFSKKRLAEFLRSADIQYIHVKALGSPKSLRERLYQDKDYDSFFADYDNYVQSQMNILEELYEEVVSRETACLMCLERDPFQCHRKVVADKIKEIDGNGLVIKHI